MKLERFCNKIKFTLKNFSSSSSREFLNQLIDIESMRSQNIFKMTSTTILFEGFYQSVETNSALKKQLTKIRLERWESHFGAPTINFLLTYNKQIKETKLFFESEASSFKPWEADEDVNLIIDQDNEVAVRQQAIDQVPMPKENEETGKFLKTHNPSGGFTTTPCDIYSQQFIEQAGESAKNNGVVLEIGAAFGAATLQALARGATVFCNDIDVNNLAVIKKRFQNQSNSTSFSVTGDDNKLVLIPGAFPDELANLPANFFDAILICRVLHFFTGDQIEKSLQQLLEKLKPNGKLYIVCETPFLKNWKQFIPEHDKRMEMGVKWPGEITNPADFESSGRAAALPKFVHWITKEILQRVLTEAKYGIELLTYINRSGQFPEDLLLDGRESIGAVALKPNQFAT